MHLSPVYPWFTSHLQRITHFGQLPLKTLIYLECSSILSWHQKCQHLFSGCFRLGLNLEKHVAMGQNSESQKGRFNMFTMVEDVEDRLMWVKNYQVPSLNKEILTHIYIYIIGTWHFEIRTHYCQLLIGTPSLTHGHVRSHLGQFGAECGLVHRRGSRQGARLTKRGAAVGAAGAALSVCYVTWWPYGNYM